MVTHFTTYPRPHTHTHAQFISLQSLTNQAWDSGEVPAAFISKYVCGVVSKIEKVKNIYRDTGGNQGEESEIRGESIKILIAPLCVHCSPIYYSLYLEGSMQDDPFLFRLLPAHS